MHSNSQLYIAAIRHELASSDEATDYLYTIAANRMDPKERGRAI